MFSSELDPNLDHFVILLPFLGHLASLHHFLFTRNWSVELTKTKTRGVIQFSKKYFLENDINCALRISSLYTMLEKRLHLMFQLSFENLVKRDLDTHFLTCSWYELSTTLHDKGISSFDI
jgi:hypothetical protein